MVNPRAETRLVAVEGILEEICDCFSLSIDSESMVTEDNKGDDVEVNSQLTILIKEAQRILFDEPSDIETETEEYN